MYTLGRSGERSWQSLDRIAAGIKEDREGRPQRVASRRGQDEKERVRGGGKVNGPSARRGAGTPKSRRRLGEIENG